MNFNWLMRIKNVSYANKQCTHGHDFNKANFDFFSFCFVSFRFYHTRTTTQQPIGHQNAPLGRPQTLTVYDATKFVKQAQAARLLNESTATANRNGNSNSIRNNQRKSNESVTSQENSSIESNRFPNTRNRFHPLSTTKLPAGSNTNINRASTTLSPQYTSPEPLISSPTVPIAPSDADSASNAFDQRQNRIPISSRFGTSREQNTSVRINKFLRQPTYSSREANQQQTPKRINITHNGSETRDASNAGVSQEVIY